METLGDEAAWEIERVARAAGLCTDLDRIHAYIRDLTAPCVWPTRSKSAPPLPHGFNFKRPFSTTIAWSRVRGVEVGFLFEPQSESGSAIAYWRAGLQVAERIPRLHGASIERLRAIEDLVAPSLSAAPFRILYSCTFRAGAAPGVTLHLCSSSRNVEFTRRRMREALRRLEVPIELRDDDAATILSLNLDEDLAKTDLYLLWREATLDDVRPLPPPLRSLAYELVEAIYGTASPPRRWQAALRSDGKRGPITSTLHVALHRDGPPSESIEVAISSFSLSRIGPADAYLRARAALGPDRSAHHFVTLRLEQGQPHLCVCFSPRHTRAGVPLEPLLA